jgi:hypothetical protein
LQILAKYVNEGKKMKNIKVHKPLIVGPTTAILHGEKKVNTVEVSDLLTPISCCISELIFFLFFRQMDPQIECLRCGESEESERQQPSPNHQQQIEAEIHQRESLMERDIEMYEDGCKNVANLPTDAEVDEWCHELLNEQDMLMSHTQKERQEDRFLQLRWEGSEDFRQAYLKGELSADFPGMDRRRPRITISPSESSNSSHGTPDKYDVTIEIPGSSKGVFTVDKETVEQGCHEVFHGDVQNVDNETSTAVRALLDEQYPHTSIQKFKMLKSMPTITEELSESPHYITYESPASPTLQSQLGGPVSPRGVKRPAEEPLSAER